MLSSIGIVFAVLTFVFGEYHCAEGDRGRQKSCKLSAKGAAVSQEFRSGLWTKDVIRENGVSGKVVGTRFLNVREMRPSGELLGLRIYEFDTDFHLSAYIIAARADYARNNTWNLTEVTESRVQATPPAAAVPATLDLKSSACRPASCPRCRWSRRSRRRSSRCCSPTRNACRRPTCRCTASTWPKTGSAPSAIKSRSGAS